MRFIALGGAREVGAACYFVEIDGKCLLLDCGLRPAGVTTASSNLLPNFDYLEGVDAIFISHAHLDHVGGLPIAMRRFSSAYCFMTIPTFPLAITMLLDVIKRVEREYVGAHPLGKFSEETLEQLADRVLTVKFQNTFHPFKNSPLTATFLRAGHILGAAGILNPNPAA